MVLQNFLVPSLPPLSPPSVALSHPDGQKPAAPVGKVICDMIPHKLGLAVLKSSLRPPLPKLELIVVAADPGAMVVTPVPSMLLPPPTTLPPSGDLFPRIVVVNPTPHSTLPATLDLVLPHFSKLRQHLARPLGYPRL